MTSEPEGDGWSVTGVGRTPQPLEMARTSNRAMSRAGANLHKFRECSLSGTSPLLATFGWREAVDPLVGLGTRELAEGLTDTALEAGDAILAPQFLREGPKQVDLALTSLLRGSPLPSPRSCLLRCALRIILYDLGLRASSPAVRGGAGGAGALDATRGWVGGRRSLVSVREFFEGSRADVHGVPQGAGLGSRLRHADD